MTQLNDPELVAREYATAERLERRRHDVTGWVRGDEPAEALAAVSEVRPYCVLDAGCGDGRFARTIAAPHVVGVDSSPAMVARARARGIDAHEADIQELPFPDGEFDAVVCNWTLYHLPDVDRGVAELARVLRSGGRFVGVYNGEGHMSELWSLLRPDFVQADDYDDVLGAHFARVERRDVEGQTLWETRADLEAFLEAFVELLGPLEAPPGPYPFKATRRNRVYVADKG